MSYTRVYPALGPDEYNDSLRVGRPQGLHMWTHPEYTSGDTYNRTDTLHPHVYKHVYTYRQPHRRISVHLTRTETCVYIRVRVHVW